MKKLLMLIIAVMMATLIFGQVDITIGTGTSTGRYPLNDYYVYSRSQCIYLESEIGAPGTIHKLRWYRNDTGADANAIGTTQVWLKTVPNAVMTDVNWEDPGTMVYEIANIDLGAGGAWYELDITDFAYNGGNLLVSVYTQNAPYTAPHSYWRYTTTTGFNRCRMGNNDSTNPPTLSLSTSRPNIQINMTTSAPTLAPNPAILVSPLNGGWAMIGDNLVWNSGGGFPAGYDVYFGTTTTPPLVSDNQTATSYTPTLAPGTTYYWKVIPYNAFGDAAGVTLWSFNTPAATQLVESFEPTAFPPAGWANPGTWSRSTSYAKHGTASAYKYGSTSAAYVLSTPRLTLTGSSTLDLWTLASGTTGTLQVVYSPDRVTWTPVGPAIAHAATYTWYNTWADLSSLAGNNYYIGVQTGLQAVGFYVDLAIGPMVTPEAPGPVTLSTPADLATNVTEYATFTWTAPTTGGAPTGYAVYCGLTNPPSYTTDLIGSTAAGVLTFTATAPLAYNTTYYWTVKAFNGTGDATVPTPRSFTTRANPTISTFPWEVNFGTVAADWPVLNWNQLTGLYGTTPVAGTSWYQDDFANVTAPLNKAAKINIWTTTVKGWLITPPIAIPATGYELKFDIALTDYAATVPPTAGEQADDKFIVLVDDNPNMTSPTILREWNNTGSPYVYDNVSNTGENHIIDLDAYTGTVYFAFYGESTVAGGDNDFFVDNVIVRETPAAPIFTYAPAAINFGTVMQNVAATAQNVTVSNTGGGTINLSMANISIIGTDAAMFSYVAGNLPATLAGGQSVVIPVTVTVTSEGAKSATLRITWNAVNYDVALSATGLPAGIVVIGNGTADLDLPINAYYGYTYSQSIFLQSEINTPNQRIESVYYYWNGVAEAVNSNDWTIYMGHTPLTSFDTTTSWIPLANLSTVFTGTVALPATAGWIQIPLTAPFIYNNTDNLVIAVDENAASYDGSSEFFYGTAAATNRSIRYYSDSTNPDPAAPVAGTQILGYPNVMLSFGDLPAGMPDPVTMTYPADGTVGLPVTGFNFTWAPAATGGTPTSWELFLASSDQDITNDYLALYEPTGTSFNAVTEGGFTFDYSTRYYWAVNAINAEGSALSSVFWFDTEAMPPIVSEFPYTVDFEAHADNTLPTGWTRSTLGTGVLAGWQVGSDLGSDYWAVPAHTVYAASNDDAANTNSSMDLLVTPQLDFSAAHVGIPVLSFNSFYTGQYSQLATVEISVAGGDWTTLHTVVDNSAWTTVSVGMVDYNNLSNVKLRFHADDSGVWASGWAIDNVSVYYSTVDEIAPVIATLPLLNTPRTDISYTVYADIADDTTWNNGISSANLFYAIDGGAFSSVPMTLDTRVGYYAVIPAQVLDTQVDYYIEASDASPAMNTATSATFTFHVENPTWLWYDTGGTIYIGYTTVDFGPMVQFSNPYYGTGTTLQLLGSDGSSYTATTANLNVYTWDGVGDLVPAITPVPVSFGAETYHTFDLSSYNIQITTPYFFISYEDIPMNNYILFDETYDYGTSYVWQNGSLYTMARYGSWAIGANITSVQGAEAPVVSIANVGGVPVLSWDATAGMAYNVYAAADPYATDPWTLLTTTSAGTYSYTGTEGMRFFKVTSDSAPIRASVSGRTGSVNAPVITIKPNTQPTFNLKADREKK